MLQLFLALLPFILITYLLVVRKVAASTVMLWAFLITLSSLLFVWRQPFVDVLSSSLKGFFITIDLLLIIAGVLLIFTLLSRTKHLVALEKFFVSLSDKAPVHVVLIGFFFVMFLEGIAGFGTPALIAAPLLVLVGLRPLSAVVLTLVADSMAVVFGAFGTPVVVGLAGLQANLLEVSFLSALLAGSVLLFLPTLMLFLYGLLEHKSFAQLRPFLRLTVVSGLLTAGLFVLSAYIFGSELPTVLASLGGLVIVLVLLRTPLLGVRTNRGVSSRQALPAILAYLSAVFLLVFSRADVFGFGSLLQSLSVSVSLTNGVSHSFSAYTPGVLLLLAFVLCLLFIRPSQKQIRGAVFDAYTKAAPVLFTLAVTLMFAQLIIYSPSPSIPSLLAGLFSGTNTYYVFFASLIGAFGSFVAGSATVSNLMLASVQLDAAVVNSVSESLVLALQTVGAGAGNMVAIHNVLAVLAVVHVKGGVSSVIRVTGLVAIVLCLFVSVVAFLL
ncbi:MAG: L-lactate permease [Candidatus Woesearchaeota archaeon]